MLDMWETDREQEPLRLSFQCDFGGEVVDKESLIGQAEEGSNLSQ